MKKLILSTAALALSTSFALAQDVVRLGTEGAYPPFNLINDSGEVDGFERELGDELCKRAELNCSWVTNDWDSIIPNLTSGNYDAILAGMSITEEREAVIDFTEAYFPPDPSIYVSLDEDVDLDGGVVAAQAGTIQANHVAASGATLVEFATGDEAVAAVRNGEADAAFGDKGFLAPIANEDPDLHIVSDDVMLGKGIGMGLRKSDAELKTTFDAAIRSMKEDGSLNELIAKWFDGMEGPY
ncbi:transporter substrate-binding domain-containing protein [Tropicimonas sp.]|uniref:transporter substrate-binding domain-containing protein n=1 Tax=Tropicimonas sp. TaxID=2067044 RepID=UPI003A8C54C4